MQDACACSLNFVVEKAGNTISCIMTTEIIIRLMKYYNTSGMLYTSGWNLSCEQPCIFFPEKMSIMGSKMYTILIIFRTTLD